ncbi:tRNA1(Val) (adenine(37)-N6)-methyltransferase [Telmatospirillum siberiense]|uniref:Methyltransferase n=1 Tax=Telmatospirillum siberiense TaxID=382514 RepID=A0A2N3PPD3_9PROT|nr:methyltransferase [Telmatospirillum siberiense]PKU22261.1 methyltransferase [Telmatospirillum siberiense]
MDEVSEDALLDGRVKFRQPVDGYRAAIDPVFLAAAVPAKDGQSVLDVGSGVGAASLCLAARVPGARLFGLEAQPPLVALARENIAMNGMTGRVESLIGSLQAPPPRLAPGSFHHVMTNPPYQALDEGRASPHPGKAMANQEGEVDLAAWMRFAINMLQPKGTLVVVYRADRLDDLLAALNRRVGEIVILPLWPKAGRPAKRVLLRARKGVSSPVTLLPGMILHEEDGRYSASADAVLRHGAALA